MRPFLWVAPALALLLCPVFNPAQSQYYRHVLFDNSLTPDTYFYSHGMSNGDSFLEQQNGRLPVETATFLTPPNALRIQWQSAPNGGWNAEIGLADLRNRRPGLDGRYLYFWLYAPQAIAAADLPKLVLSNSSEGLQVAEFPASFTEPLDLAKYTGDLPAGHWTQVRIPLADCRTASIYPFKPEFLHSITFHQARADNVRHTLFVDEIRVDDEPASIPAPPSPAHLRATGYDRHIELEWSPVAAPNVARYVVYRSRNGGKFVPIGTQLSNFHRYEDFLGKPDIHAEYKVTAADWKYKESPPSPVAAATTRELSDDELLTMLQKACFEYYWEAADPHSGMARENIPGDDRIVATGASGFAIMALVVGVDRGFITREQGAERMARIVGFLAHADRYHGVWSHYMNGATGHTMPVFGMYDNGGDLVETSFLMQGLLTARQYFHGPTAAEQKLDRDITHLWETVEWDWYRETPNSNFLYWHWSPEWGFQIHHPLIGFNEVMMAYLLGIASPTHGVPAGMYYSGWSSQAEMAATLPRRLVRHQRRKPLRQRQHLLRDQARCRRRSRRPAVFHPLFVHGLRSTQPSRPLHQLLL